MFTTGILAQQELANGYRDVRGALPRTCLRPCARHSARLAPISRRERFRSSRRSTISSATRANLARVHAPDDLARHRDLAREIESRGRPGLQLRKTARGDLLRHRPRVAALAVHETPEKVGRRSSGARRRTVGSDSGHADAGKERLDFFLRAHAGMKRVRPGLRARTSSESSRESAPTPRRRPRSTTRAAPARRARAPVALHAEGPATREPDTAAARSQPRRTSPDANGNCMPTPITRGMLRDGDFFASSSSIGRARSKRDDAAAEGGQRNGDAAGACREIEDERSRRERSGTGQRVAASSGITAPWRRSYVDAP